MLRREFVGLGGAAGLISCAPCRGEYFGSTAPPSARRLVHSLPGEPDTLDPAKSPGGIEFWVVPALLEGLTQCHPQRPDPMAALATHYIVSPRQDQFTFFLRGHPAPSGLRLPSANDLPADFRRGRQFAADNVQARWSDGQPITAHDFVYSWRRFLDPKSAAPMAYQLYCVRNAEEVNTGKLSPRDLGVRALDDFTFQVDLRSSTPYFLQLITQYIFSPVPRHAVDAAVARGNEDTWTDPQHIVVSGPFTLREWRKYARLVAVRNTRYYDNQAVAIDELEFVTVVDGTTTVNLYKTGRVAAMPGLSFPYLFKPLLGRKKDFHTAAAFACVGPTFNVRAGPVDNVLVRYALNMATEKTAFCEFMGSGRSPAVTLVPPIPGYPRINTLPVEIGGQTYDVLSFNVECARALLVKAGYSTSESRPLDITYNIGMLPEAPAKAEMLRDQWLRNLGIRLNIVAREFSVHWKMVIDGDYAGIADYGFLPTYFDPNPFLDPFLTAGPGNPTGWTDPDYPIMLAAANQTLDRAERMAKLARCERRVLTAMPFIPIYFDVLEYLLKPFIKGLASNVFDMRSFKYAWIDTSWRPQ